MRCVNYTAAIDEAGDVRAEISTYGKISLFLGDQFGPTAHLILTDEAAQSIIDALTKSLQAVAVAS